MEHPAVVAVVSAHARHVPADERARLAARLESSTLGAEAVLLHTCQRVEAYALLSEEGLPAAGLPEESLPARLRDLPNGTRCLRGPDAVRHAMAVAAGLDSTVLGEDQVLHQFRDALGAARSRGLLPAEIERLCQAAMQAGRRARARRIIPPRSLADAALERLARALERGAPSPERHAPAPDPGPRTRESLAGARLLIVGAGEMGHLLAAGAARRGAALAIASRTRARADRVARVLAVASAPFAATDELATVDAVAIALRGTWPLEDAGRAALLERRPAIVDLSEPSALDVGLRGALASRLSTIDDLVGAEADPADARLRAHLEEVVERATADYLAWLEARASASTIQALVEVGETRRREAVGRLLRRLPDLDPSARAAVEKMSQQLVAGILHEPVARLRRDDGSRTAAARDLFGL